MSAAHNNAKLLSEIVNEFNVPSLTSKTKQNVNEYYEGVSVKSWVFRIKKFS